jgi:hypothetical protein
MNNMRHRYDFAFDYEADHTKIWSYLYFVGVWWDRVSKPDSGFENPK